ncbi:hypothetical protein [Rhizobium sp. WYCCWR10014]|uniref:hypothetical protein n=1 Tax=Rhizobium sp. WYCCWR10014 TaxID=1825933 RepID=UPI001FDABC26|nr:hypothetical protein [Rhizobium sp. WYCCWR10014]
MSSKAVGIAAGIMLASTSAFAQSSTVTGAVGGAATGAIGGLVGAPSASTISG